MKTFFLSLLLSTALFSPINISGQETAEEIQAQIESLQKKLDEINQTSNDTDNAENQEVDKADWGKRSSPVPLGEFIEVVDTEYGDEGRFNARLNLKIDNITRGQEALDFILEENMFNNPAPQGYEWVVIDLEVEYLSGSEDYPYTPNIRFNVFDSTGKQVDQSDFASLSLNFRDTDIFPGIVHTGKQTFMVPSGDDFVFTTALDKLYFFDSK